MAVAETRARRGAGYFAVIALAVLLVFLGAVLTIGGGWLAILGGSPYYLIAGAGLIASGLLMARMSPLGAAAYALVFLGTAVWAFWEVGLAGWPLLPRLVAPTIILFAVIAAVPVLLPGRQGRRLALGSAGGALVAVLIAGIAIGITNRPAPAGAAPQPTGSMTDPSLAVAGADWPAYGGSYSARRYSPLQQITPANVDQLEQVWLTHTGDVPEERFGAETTPLKVGDTLYLCSARNILIALDATSGRERWRYDPKVSDKAIPYTAACRGVTYYAVPDAEPGAMCATRIIEGTLDGRLIAVDARTGAPCAEFGSNGQVDIKAGMGDVFPGMVSITSPPTLVRGVLVTGHQVLDGEMRQAPSGVVQGFDAVTGALRWAWDLARPDRTGAPLPHETYTPGTPNMWTTASGDEALGHVYLPMGNSAVDYLSGTRSEAENRYSTALVALDVTTGKPAWSFQTVYKDVWDYDLGSQATLVDFPTATGGRVPAVLVPSKQGDIYVLDRRTGRPLTGVEERPVPQGGVEPAQRTAVQPFSRYHTLRKPDLVEKQMWGMSPIDQMICRIQFHQAQYDGYFTPPTTDKPWIQYPGYNGGSDWGGIAVDPARGLIVANYNDMPNYNRLIPRSVADREGWLPRARTADGEGTTPKDVNPQAGAPFAIKLNPGWRMPITKLLCKEPPYGGIRAIDLATGKTVWDRPLGQARKNGPFGVPTFLPVNIGTPNNGGAVVTAGGLVFIAAATDDLIRAIDIRTGETVWSASLPAGGQATPMTYEVGGKQYLVIMTGGHHFMETRVGDQVIAYALP